MRADPMGQMLPVSMIQEFWGPSVPVVSFSTLFEYVRSFVGLEDLEASAPFSLMVQVSCQVLAGLRLDC